jgi:hypothetical protein
LNWSSALNQKRGTEKEGRKNEAEIKKEWGAYLGDGFDYEATL